jgi:hypothetical protein
MRSIVLSLLLLITGFFAGGAAHAHASTPFPRPAAHDWIETAASQAAAVPADPADPALAIFEKCPPHPALQAAGPEAVPQAVAASCGGAAQITLDDRNEMIWLDNAPKELALAYFSPRNAVAPHGLPAAWQRAPLRPPRA